MSPLARTAVSLVVSALAVAAVPLAAHASAYPPADSTRVSSAVVEPGGSVDVTVAEATFAPGEPVTITTTGENASAVAYGTLRLAPSTATYHDARANAAGGLDPVAISFPENAAGVYTIAVFSASSPGDTVTVTTAGLASTGTNPASALGIWIGGGALVLAGVVVAVAIVVRRARERADV